MDKYPQTTVARPNDDGRPTIALVYDGSIANICGDSSATGKIDLIVAAAYLIYVLRQKPTIDVITHKLHNGLTTEGSIRNSTAQTRSGYNEVYSQHTHAILRSRPIVNTSVSQH